MYLNILEHYGLQITSKLKTFRHTSCVSKNLKFANLIPYLKSEIHTGKKSKDSSLYTASPVQVFTHVTEK